MDMKCLLIEIRKFLKRLETGQMELEAGQWELHKEISYLKTSIESLEKLKLDLQLMKSHGLKQTDLIKKLQSKLNVLEEIRKSDNGDHWSSFSSNYELNNCFNKGGPPPKNGQKRERPKTAAPITDRRNADCPSQDIISVSESLLKLKHEKELNSSKDARQDVKKSKQQNVIKDPCKSSTISILQRYLKDSSKYLNKPPKNICKGRKSKTRMSCFPNKALSETLKIEMQGESTPSLLVKSKPAPPKREKYNCFKCSKKLRHKHFSSRYRVHNSKSLYLCDVCRKKFLSKNNFKKHEKIHHGLSDLTQKKQSSKRFRGFRCSYCDKICRSPEKLTEHLESCRIISRRNARRK